MLVWPTRRKAGTHTLSTVANEVSNAIWMVVEIMTLSVTPRDASLASQYSASPAVFRLVCRSRHDLPFDPLLSQTQDVTSRSAAVARPSAPWHGTRFRKAASNAQQESCVVHVFRALQKKQACCLLGSGSCFGFFAGGLAALIRSRSARTPLGARWTAAAHGGLPAAPSRRKKFGRNQRNSYWE